ncbi:MAG TPA: 50S ribosomal protein L21 [Candidatus Dormibacteraeota bacterium]|nr:50S ribosomal protein L21 [Candidatus Dormibacteraeota bacterium]
MYAILKHGGHQYRVAAGDRLLVDRLEAEIGSKVTLEPVLFVADGDSAEVGAGAVAGAKVVATVVAHRRGRKLRVFTYKPKKRHRRTLGYRSQLTELIVEEVATATASSKRQVEKPAPKAAKAAASAEAAATAPAEVPATPPAEAAPEAPRRARRTKAATPDASAPEATADDGPAESDLAAEAAAEADAPKAKRTTRPRRKADGA